ncbi:MAG: TPM domain-containing protein [Butyrivibrio sp.]|nr:TPM domain-containing protein [Butyrivibrio sp.]
MTNIKRLFKSALMFALLLGIFGGAGYITSYAADYYSVVDNADLLSDSEEEALAATLDDIAATYEADVIIVTTDSTDGKTATAYADDFYDYNGYGKGSDRSGILFLLSMEDRSWAISTCGSSIYVFTDYRQQTIIDNLKSDLSSGYYYDAFNSFASDCRYYYQADIDSQYEPGGRYYNPVNAKAIGISLVIGFLIALIPIGIMFAQLKTVKFATGAASYENTNSRTFSVSRDHFIRHVVTKTPIPKSSDGGGSSTHTSSSGTSHGGSSGHF